MKGMSTIMFEILCIGIPAKEFYRLGHIEIPVRIILCMVNATWKRMDWHYEACLVVLLVSIVSIGGVRVLFTCHSDICNRYDDDEFCSVQFSHCRTCAEVQDDCYTERMERNCTAYCKRMLEVSINQSIANGLEAKRKMLEVSINQSIADGLEAKRTEGCSGLPVISHGQINQKMVKYGEFVMVTCDMGFEPTGTVRLQCGDYGVLSPQPPICREIKCSPPPKSLNGQWNISGSYYPVGMAATFSCPEEYTMSGCDHYTCTISGTWISDLRTDEMPFCVKDVLQWYIPTCGVTVGFIILIIVFVLIYRHKMPYPLTPRDSIEDFKEEVNKTTRKPQGKRTDTTAVTASETSNRQTKQKAIKLNTSEQHHSKERKEIRGTAAPLTPNASLRYQHQSSGQVQVINNNIVFQPTNATNSHVCNFLNNENPYQNNGSAPNMAKSTPNSKDESESTRTQAKCARKRPTNDPYPTKETGEPQPSGTNIAEDSSLAASNPQRPLAEETHTQEDLADGSFTDDDDTENDGENDDVPPETRPLIEGSFTDDHDTENDGENDDVPPETRPLYENQRGIKVSADHADGHTVNLALPNAHVRMKGGEVC